MVNAEITPAASVIAAPPVRLWNQLYRAPKQSRENDRLHSAAETLELIRPFFGQAGITRLANITGLDRLGFPVALAIRPNSRSITTSAGKGLTPDAAMVSAAMEGIEVFHAETLIPTLHRTTYREVEKQYAVIPVECLHLRKHTTFQPDWPHDWLLGWDMLHHMETAVPYSSVSLSGPRQAYDFAIFESSSNGLASGRSLLEAVIAALLEVIERDAVTCYSYRWRAQVPPPLINTRSLPFPALREVTEKLIAKGVGVLLRDCTGDTGIPVFQAYLYDRKLPALGVYHGYGAHLNAETAALRALLEAVQSRAVYIAGSRDDLFQEEFRLLRNVRHSIEQAATLRNSATTIAVAYPAQTTQSLEGDVEVLLRSIQKVGCQQAIVVNLTRADFPVSVVKVIVPGLEGHMGEHYTPGRLLGRRTQLQ